MKSRINDTEEKVKNIKIMFACVFALLMITSCGPEPVDPALPNLPAMEVVGTGPSPTPVIPTGGTYTDPVINMTGFCSTYENYTFNILYSPGDLSISRVINPAYSDFIALPCSVIQPGQTSCTTRVDPSTSTVALEVCYRNPDSVDETCRELSMFTPGCPAPEASLVSVDCLFENRVHFVVDRGAGYIQRECVCAYNAEGMCSCGIDGTTYECGIMGDTRLECEGAAPTGDYPLRVVYFVWGQNLDTDEPYNFLFDDFYSQYRASCLTLAPRPTAVEPTQPSACSTYKTASACDKADCYWWLAYGCKKNADPCAGFKENACSTAITCKWDGTNCYTP
jgi:hypothetical protein